jgi:segregation and condensation protein B
MKSSSKNPFFPDAAPLSLSAILESILFVRSEPATLAELARLVKRSEDDVREALGELETDLEGRGVVLLQGSGRYQLGSHPGNAAYIETLLEEELGGELSRPALETLAAIAYRGPIGRADIEYLRGVNCSFILRSLLLRGLIEKTEDGKDGRSFLYRVSFDFLRLLGVKRLEDLPHYGEYHKVVVGDKP